MRELLISIHDVMPSTLEQTEQIIERLRCRGLLPVTLLVVPNRGWDPETLARLREWVVSGDVELAGHGWNHHVEEIHGIHHRLHSLLISKQVAEHLALDSEGGADLMRRCYGWFQQQGLPEPRLYVPPAWALGQIDREALSSLPYDMIETLTGIHHLRSGKFQRSAMLGYEAYNLLQSWGCRAWNRFNLAAAGLSGPLRLAIHPQDFQLRLSTDLSRLLEGDYRAVSYARLGK